jgi:hypothetical protein
MNMAIQSQGKEPAKNDRHQCLRNDYLKRLMRYQKTDETLRRKYSMSFEEFETGEVLAQRDYSWDVESDAIIWKTAIDGIETMRQKLQALSENP